MDDTPFNVADLPDPDTTHLSLDPACGFPESPDPLPDDTLRDEPPLPYDLPSSTTPDLPAADLPDLKPAADLPDLPMPAADQAADLPVAWGFPAAESPDSPQSDLPTPTSPDQFDPRSLPDTTAVDLMPPALPELTTPTTPAADLPVASDLPDRSAESLPAAVTPEQPVTSLPDLPDAPEMNEGPTHDPMESFGQRIEQHIGSLLQAVKRIGEQLVRPTPSFSNSWSPGLMGQTRGPWTE